MNETSVPPPTPSSATAEAQRSGAVAVRCSAWLGVAGVQSEAWKLKVCPDGECAIMARNGQTLWISWTDMELIVRELDPDYDGRKCRYELPLTEPGKCVQTPLALSAHTVRIGESFLRLAWQAQILLRLSTRLLWAKLGAWRQRPEPIRPATCISGDGR